MSLATLNALYSAAAAAMDGEQWDAAIISLMKLQAKLATMPNTRRNAGGNSESLDFNPADLASLITQCRQMKTQAALAAGSSGPWQSSKISYQRASSS